MLHIVTCDDEPEQLELVSRAVKTYFSPAQNVATSVSVSDFSCARDLLAALDSSSPCDIALLDICMGDMNGIKLAREILRRSPVAKIIFLTTSQDYAVEAFALGAVHYLVKPFSQKDFAIAMERALSALPEQPKKITVTGERGRTSVVNMDDIICVESVGHERIVTTKDGSLTELRKTLQGFLQEFERLSPGQFILPYRGYVINLAAVHTVLPLSVEMEGGIKIPLKRGDYTAIKNALFDYSFVRGGGGGRNLNEQFLADCAGRELRHLRLSCGVPVPAFRPQARETLFRGGELCLLARVRGSVRLCHEPRLARILLVHHQL